MNKENTLIITNVDFYTTTHNIFDCVINNFHYLKASFDYAFQTSNVLNTAGYYLIDKCLYRSLFFQ